MASEVKIDKSYQRQSNIEILRILSMSMIVIWHFYWHGGLANDRTNLWIPAVFNSGVDIFILISGYFSIKARWSKIISLGILIIVFGGLNILCYGWFGHIEPKIVLRMVIVDVISPFSSSYNWFVQIYFILIVLSPIINRALRGLETSDLRKLVIVLSFVEFYSCWLAHNMVDNQGYSLYTFIYLYILGYYLRCEGKERITKKWILCLAIIFAISINGISLCCFDTEIFIGYSSPVTVVLSASILMLFAHMKFYSKYINSLATAAFGVYLIQDGIFGRSILYPYQCGIYESCSGYGYFLFCVCVFIGFWMSSWVLTFCINRFSQKLIINPRLKKEIL